MKIRLIFKSVVINNMQEQVFVEAHDENGKSINIGGWSADGEYECLEIDIDAIMNRANVENLTKLSEGIGKTFVGELTLPNNRTE